MHNGTQIVQHRSGTLTRHKERAPVFVPRLLESPPCSRSTTRGSLMPSNGAVPSPAAAHIRWPRCVLSHRRLPDACSAGPPGRGAAAVESTPPTIPFTHTLITVFGSRNSRTGGTALE